MTISFVIPAYNEELYVGTCIQSILEEQKASGAEIQIIVVNNASTDSTKQAALAFPGVTVVDEMRKGLTFARQAGLAASTGELIANVDADSILPQGWMNTVVHRFQNDPKLIALSGPAVYYDLGIMKNILIRIYYYAGFFSYLINRHILRIGSLLQGGNFTVRKSALEKVGGFDTAISFYGEDTDIARRLHPLGPVVFTFALPMYTSGRRLATEGIIKMGWKYPLNFFWISFFKKPFHEEYIDIRPTQHELASLTTVSNLTTTINIITYVALSIILGIILYAIR